ncbi:penicillin-binding protein activator LpoB [Pseudomonas gingeri]|uniref:Penicillin-binding protein activator LpoB n=1 Tax=Pseudomonas gingeri TaxID=117681 RepID=A0A7Y7YEF2_9PSED|nr:penicillin-binding protein activator LpoB [Pseudomonas gingeri]NWA04266.1 penicillin-binding protein activator LpoB [Pseudomonas gingeri]NWA15159.1 penicillin-binding protein activator LpoB [Pseudomonas gingeri]NWA54600.1 penicillin-binding protein activator LpoB [Pseudomonas gingeri]NWA98357.1 penicillin-binding protein activator LpoB [Pseudomonas gingeri]NWB04129.1 penicillin-binding protein activator LpoB [Pseudomonas gingeri]
MRAWIGIIGLACAFGVQAAPKVAVADLAYQAQVEQYIRSVSARNNYQQSYYGASGSSSYDEYESRSSYIEQGELRKFTGDIKGEILRSGMFQLIQSTPYTASSKGDVYDVIKRIKGGSFKGADYVLFGTVSDIDFTQDINELANTNSYSAVLGLTLVGDFSLINTRTYEITSAFTAMGEGQDTKLVNSRDVRVSLNRPRVVRDVSKSLGEDVARQLSMQLGGPDVYPDARQPLQRNNLPPDEAPRILN